LVAIDFYPIFILGMNGNASMLSNNTESLPSRNQRARKTKRPTTARRTSRTTRRTSTTINRTSRTVPSSNVKSAVRSSDRTTRKIQAQNGTKN
jgi:hypothetical protein